MEAKKIRKFLEWQWAFFMAIMVIAFTIFPNASVTIFKNGKQCSSSEIVALLAILLTISHFVAISFLFFTGRTEEDDVALFFAVAIGSSFFLIVLPRFSEKFIYYLVGVITITAMMYHFPNFPDWSKKLKKKLSEFKLG